MAGIRTVELGRDLGGRLLVTEWKGTVRFAGRLKDTDGKVWVWVRADGRGVVMGEMLRPGDHVWLQSPAIRRAVAQLENVAYESGVELRLQVMGIDRGVQWRIWDLYHGAERAEMRTYFRMLSEWVELVVAAE